MLKKFPAKKLSFHKADNWLAEGHKYATPNNLQHFLRTCLGLFYVIGLEITSTVPYSLLFCEGISKEVLFCFNTTSESSLIII